MWTFIIWRPILSFSEGGVRLRIPWNGSGDRVEYGHTSYQWSLTDGIP